MVQGTDLKNVTLVVQFLVPDTLSVWMQRAGWAGRSGAPSAAILLYEPSVVQKIKGKEADESGDEGDEDPDQHGDEGEEFKKKNVEGSLRSYVMTATCRRVVTDEYFGTPVRNVEGMVRFNVCIHKQDTQPIVIPAYSVPCCDNCIRKANPSREFTDITHLVESVLPALKINEPITQDTPPHPSAKATKGVGPRCDERRAACRDFLTRWRVDCWVKNHKDEVWGPEILLPDKVLTKLAATASLKTKEDIKEEVEGWWFWEMYSQEVLDGLREIDKKFEAIKAAKEADRLDQQQIERERRAAMMLAERQRALEEKERKHALKEAARQEEKCKKDELRRQKEEVRRQKEVAREEVKRQREEVKRQREEAKRQREEIRQQKRQREERGETEAAQFGNSKQKRQCLDDDFSTLISSSLTLPPAGPMQPGSIIRPRPQPTRRAPPSSAIETAYLSPPPPPMFPPFLPLINPHPYEAQLQFVPQSYQDFPPNHPLWQGTPNVFFPYPQSMTSPLQYPQYPMGHSHILPQAESSMGGREHTGSEAAVNPGDDHHSTYTSYCFITRLVKI